MGDISRTTMEDLAQAKRDILQKLDLITPREISGKDVKHPHILRELYETGYISGEDIAGFGDAGIRLIDARLTERGHKLLLDLTRPPTTVAPKLEGTSSESKPRPQWRYASLFHSILTVPFFVIGLGGVPENMRTWKTWLEPVLSAADSEIVRWLFVIGAVLALVVINVILPQKRKKRSDASK